MPTSVRIPASETKRRSPYQGLIPYGEDDAPYFFGRERETRLIVANLFASPLTLLYGASGVGKSSVLRAGAVHQLRERDDLLVAVFSAWQADPAADLKAALAREAERAGAKVPPPSGSTTLARYVAACAKKSKRRLMIILDQFEEYFLYHPQEGAFDAELPRAVLQREAPVSFLISLREDALAKLDRFEGHIPTLFDNYLRVEHLDRAAARAAIEKPVARYNELRAASEPKASVEHKLVEAVLRQVGAGQVTLQEAGQGVIRKSKAASSHVETPYLQMVMTRLWNEEVQQGFYKLRLKTLERLGGAESIVRTHLDTVMDALPKRKQDIAALVFHHLVTPSGSKIAHTLADLSEYVGISERRLAPVLEDLQKGDVRILRRVAAPSARPDAPPRYEIFHDVLAAAILDWRARYNKVQERAEAERKIEQERKRAEEQAEAARRLRELADEARKARAEAVRQEKLAVKRQAALEKAIAAIPDPTLRGKFEKYLINTQKQSSKAQRNTAAAQKKTGAVRTKSGGDRWPGLKLWENGRTLRVRFLDGDPDLQKRVAGVASEWVVHTNLRFDFGTSPDAEIRVSFKEAGSWSYVGTDALNISQTQPTINFGWLTKSTPQEEVRRVVLHEFGHVFGLIEEINNPNAQIPWNKEVVYREMTGPPNFWDKRQVEQFFFNKYTNVRYREFDPASVMMFPVSKHLTLNGFEVGTNTTLSQGDKDFVRELYPPASQHGARMSSVTGANR